MHAWHCVGERGSMSTRLDWQQADGLPKGIIVFGAKANDTEEMTEVGKPLGKKRRFSRVFCNTNQVMKRKNSGTKNSKNPYAFDIEVVREQRQRARSHRL